SAGRSEPGWFVQAPPGERLAPFLSAVFDGEAVRVVTYSLPEVEVHTRAWRDHRAICVAQPHLFQSLGRSARSDLLGTEFVECSPRGPGLGEASVHDHQVGWVGEFSGFHLGLVRVPVFSRLTHTGDLATAGTLLQIATEPAADHLVHGRDV